MEGIQASVRFGMVHDKLEYARNGRRLIKFLIFSYNVVLIACVPMVDEYGVMWLRSHLWPFFFSSL